MLDDQEARLAVNLPLNIHEAAVSQSRAALDVQLPPEPRAHTADDLPLARPERLGSLLALPFRRGLIESAVEPVIEVAE